MYNNKKVAVIIAAAGQGRRMGAPVPKQYMKIGGEYILAKTINAFEQAEEVDYTFIVTNRDYIDLCSEIVSERGFSKVLGIVNGGRERQDSVYNAIQTLNSKRPGVSIVLIHDGARPFVDGSVISSVIEAADRDGAAAACGHD